MATGPEHYREAEERLHASDYQRQEGDMEGAMHEAAAAQVHATLALAAATALRPGELPDLDYRRWYGAAGVNGGEE